MEESNASCDKRFAAPASDHAAPCHVSSELELQEFVLGGNYFAFVLSWVPCPFGRPMLRSRRFHRGAVFGPALPPLQQRAGGPGEELMNIYRLDPIEPGHLSWRFSEEKDTVWACAPTAKQARDLVAAKSGFAKYGAKGDQSPWQDGAVTSCVLQPTMSLMSPETVIREDGSLVD